jgi:hypothetical protein
MYYTLACGTELTFAGKSLADWQAEGQDQGSVIGDPGFTDPARDDFSLRPDAPAISAVGFQPFDQEIRKAGLYGDPEWCSIGSRYARRQPSATWTPEELARLVAFDMDFEDMPVGYQPEIFRLSTSGEGTFQVSDDAAYTGMKSARCTDKKGLAKGFYPLIQLMTRGLSQGPVRVSFAAMLPAATPAPLNIEFRGPGGTSEVGPALRFLADGRILADSKQVLTAPLGTWTHVEIAFQLGADAPSTYRLTLRHDGTTTVHTLPFRHDSFRDFRWLGFYGSDDVDGVFYLDDMKLILDDVAVSSP